MVKESDLKSTLFGLSKEQVCIIREAVGYSSLCVDKNDAIDDIVSIIKRKLTDKHGLPIHNIEED